MSGGRGSVPETYAGREQAFLEHELLKPYLDKASRPRRPASRWRRA
jgi:hypothetical protein